MSKEMSSHTYLLTFRCYGTWLPGDRRGWVERLPGGHARQRPPERLLHAWIAHRLKHAPFVLDAQARAVVDAALRDQCAHAAWTLHAVHVRTNHVHVVLSGGAPPERMTTQLKAWATRRLREAGLIHTGCQPWAQHGSIQPLQSVEAVERACWYVVEGQGALLDEPGDAR
jgi:hypothetical protein